MAGWVIFMGAAWIVIFILMGWSIGRLLEHQNQGS